MQVWEVVRSYPALGHLMVAMALFAMGLVIAFLSSVDVIVEGLCGHTDKCPEALYLTTVKSVIGGVAGIVVAPMLGSLSDKYGRKPFLLACIIVITLPFLVLVFSRSRLAVYGFFFGETLAACLGGGGIAWMVFFYAYIADVVPEEHGTRLAAFGAVSGMTMLGFVVGPLCAGFIPEQYSFHVSTALCLASASYMAWFVPESPSKFNLLRSLSESLSRRLSFSRSPSKGAASAAPAAAPVDPEQCTAASSSAAPSHGGPWEHTKPTQAALTAALQAVPEHPAAAAIGNGDAYAKELEQGNGASAGQSSTKAPKLAQSGPGPRMLRSRSALREAAHFFTSSHHLAFLMAVAFCHSFADNGQTSNMFYVFKANFGWTKDNFSYFTAGIGTCAIISQLVVLPLVSSRVPVKPLLVGALLVSGIHTVLYGIAWSPVMVYGALSLSTVTAVINPSIGSMVAKLAGSSDQGKLQGVMAGVSSLAGVVAPLTINPITAYFVSPDAPFNAPGFGILVAGLVDLLAFALMLMVPDPEPAAPTRIQVDAQDPRLSDTTPLLRQTAVA